MPKKKLPKKTKRSSRGESRRKLTKDDKIDVILSVLDDVRDLCISAVRGGFEAEVPELEIMKAALFLYNEDSEKGHELFVELKCRTCDKEEEEEPITIEGDSNVH